MYPQSVQRAVQKDAFRGPVHGSCGSATLRAHYAALQRRNELTIESRGLVQADTDSQAPSSMDSLKK